MLSFDLAADGFGHGVSCFQQFQFIFCCLLCFLPRFLKLLLAWRIQKSNQAFNLASEDMSQPLRRDVTMRNFILLGYSKRNVHFCFRLRG